MGALTGRTAIVTGPERLTGRVVYSRDLLAEHGITPRPIDG